MNDYDKFRVLFDSMGIRYGIPPRNPKIDSLHGEEPKASRWRITVSQAMFCFDKKKRYLGVVSDELGCFEKRKVKKRARNAYNRGKDKKSLCTECGKGGCV